jgi:outer membrane protein assembly factor BamD
MSNHLLKSLTLLFISFVLVVCSSKKPEGKTAAEVLYKEAQELMGESRYLLATEKLNTLKTQYPYSYYATHAELLQADILFLQENFIESAAAYLLFRDFHPKHEKIIYVVFKIAESYFRQLPSTFDRDLSAAHEAIKYYTEIIDKYGSSEYRDEATKKRDQCNKMLSNKEKYIADFYFKTKVYDAARFRYLKNIEESKDDSLKKHSMLKVVESSLKMKSYQDCIDYSREYEKKLEGSDLESMLTFKKECENKLP